MIRSRTVVVLALMVALAACGGSDDESAVDATSTTTPGSTATTTSTTAPEGGTATAPTFPAGSATTAANDDDTDDDPYNPWVLGYTVTVSAEATVEIEAIGIFNGEPQQPMATTRTIQPDTPDGVLFTGFIEAAEVTVTVTEGGPVTLEGIRGRLNDRDNPFGGIEVRDVLASEQIAAGESGSVEIP